MKFTYNTKKWSNTYCKAKSRGFIFEYIYYNTGPYFCIVTHSKKDIRFNSLWEGLTFETEDELREWCEKWDYKDHKCLGIDT
jgi:hypothetical protein